MHMAFTFGKICYCPISTLILCVYVCHREDESIGKVKATTMPCTVDKMSFLQVLPDCAAAHRFSDPFSDLVSHTTYSCNLVPYVSIKSSTHVCVPSGFPFPLQICLW